MNVLGYQIIKFSLQKDDVLKKIKIKTLFLACNLHIYLLIKGGNKI